MDELVVKKREQDGPFITEENRNSVCTYMLADDPPPLLHSRRHADQWWRRPGEERLKVKSRRSDYEEHLRHNWEQKDPVFDTTCYGNLTICPFLHQKAGHSAWSSSRRPGGWQGSPSERLDPGNDQRNARGSTPRPQSMARRSLPFHLLSVPSTLLLGRQEQRYSEPSNLSKEGLRI